MEATGIKFVCEQANGFINTWHCNFDKPINEIINEYKHSKNWIGGKFLEIYIEFYLSNQNLSHFNRYYKVNVDLQNTSYNLQLG